MVPMSIADLGEHWIQDRLRHRYPSFVLWETFTFFKAFCRIFQ